jgi:hypothetical protein
VIAARAGVPAGAYYTRGRRLATAEAIDTEDNDRTEDNDQLVSLLVVHPADIDPDAAQRAFADLAWLGEPLDGGSGAGWLRILTDLELPVRDGSRSTVRKSAMLDVGPVRSSGTSLRVPIAWHSATFAPLFPVFAGELLIDASMLTLSGHYAPPFGRLGLLMDQTLLHFVARRSGQALLDRVARQCGAPPA